MFMCSVHVTEVLLDILTILNKLKKLLFPIYPPSGSGQGYRLY